MCSGPSFHHSLEFGILTEKKLTLTLRETSVSWHNRGPIMGPLEAFNTTVLWQCRGSSIGLQWSCRTLVSRTAKRLNAVVVPVREHGIMPAFLAQFSINFLQQQFEAEMIFWTARVRRDCLAFAKTRCSGYGLKLFYIVMVIRWIRLYEKIRLH